MKKKYLHLGTILTIGAALPISVACSNSEVSVFKSKKLKKAININKNDNSKAIQKVVQSKPIVNKNTDHKNNTHKVNTFNLKNFLTQYSTAIADPKFVQGKIFGKAPKSVNDSDLSISNLGLDQLSKDLKKHNAKITNIKMIDSTRDDSNGTMDIKVTISLNKNNFEKTIKIKGLLVTKDIELDANKFTTIGQIITVLDNETSLGFAKGIDKMTPQDLKDELIDLQKNLSGGSLTVIGHYKGVTQAVSFQKKKLLNNLINSFGDVSHRPRLKRGWFNPLGNLKAIGNILVAIGGDVLSLFAEYGSDILTTNSQADAVDLIGSLPSKVIKMFPDLLNMFKTVAGLVKEMGIVQEWAKDHKKLKELKNIDHTLVQFVLKSGR